MNAGASLLSTAPSSHPRMDVLGRQSRGRSAVDAAIHWVLLLGTAALVAWIRLLPLSLSILYVDAGVHVLHKQASLIQIPSSVPEPERRAELRNRLVQWRAQHRAEFESARDALATQMRAQLSYQGADGARHVFLGDVDSYHWLRMARNYLRMGTTCDAIVNGQCRDTYTDAPLGRRNIYNRSLHIAAIVLLHRLATFFDAGYPLAASSFLVPVMVGILGVFPAYALGRRFGGELGGLCAALMSGVNPVFLLRSIGSDDDVWNVVLPLFMAWAAVEALYAARPRRQVGYALLAAGFAGLGAAAWSGWTFAYDVVLIALLANLAAEIVRYAAGKYPEQASSLAVVRRVATVAAVFYAGAGIFTRMAGAQSYFGLPLDLIRPLIAAVDHRPAAIAADRAMWPDVFSTVAELLPVNLSAIAGAMGSPVMLFVSWLGLLVVMLPKSGWKTQHFILLIGGNYMYWYLLSAHTLGRLGLLALLSASLGAVMLVDLFSDSVADTGGLILTVWFLGALFLSYQAVRLVMLLVPPFAIAFGTAVGRLQQWLDGQVDLRWPAAARWLRPAIFASMTAVLIIPVSQGYAAARSYHSHHRWRLVRNVNLFAPTISA